MEPTKQTRILSLSIKEVRAKLKLSTVELAQRVGVSRRTVEGWEQGRRVPDTAALLIATFFDSA